MTARRQHQDRRRRVGADLAAYLETIDIRQHHIQHNGVEAIARVQFQSRATAGGVRNSKPCAAEILAQHLGEPHVILDEEDLLHYGL